jgi:hypothetical protein
MTAAISAPAPKLPGASCTMTSRPVFSTDSTRVSVSSGLSVATSMTSQLMPSSRQVGRTQRLVSHGAPGHQRDVVALAQGEAHIQRQRLAVVRHLLLLQPVDALGLEEDHRVGVADGRQQQAVGARRRGGITTRIPGMCANIASGLSEWCSGAWMPPPKGARSTSGQCSRPRVRLRMRAAWLMIWSTAGKTKPIELDLRHRAHALGGHADGDAGDHPSASGVS